MLLRLFQLLSLLPLPALHALGAAAGWVVYACSPSYRRRLRDNLAHAGYPHLLTNAVVEAGKNIFELPFIWCATPERVLKSAVLHDWPIAQSALDAGQGVIFLTPHLGCFEIIAQAIASRAPLTALYRPPRKPSLKPLLEQARARDGLTLAPANLAGVRALLKTLRAGGAIGLLPDQVPGAGEGIWTSFFGRPAYTMTLPAKMHQMSNAPLVLTYAERLSFGRGYAIHFVRFTERLAGTPEQQARMINAAMEQLIARCPSQYFWSYNRYKGAPLSSSPPGAAA
ncbi:MAG: lysophospholipid acyltransferase family protein [Oxalobacteraceae bacterium]|jgi:KDO2-lipid IV(A) lauroyltransferase|nr:lysophospholipid acyltransferase family protein [Oxalobacteraceae bacterium]